MHAVAPGNTTVYSAQTSSRSFRSRLESTIGHASSPEDVHVPRNENNNWGPKKFQKENHVIKLMVGIQIMYYVSVCVCVNCIIYSIGGPQKN